MADKSPNRVAKKPAMDIKERRALKRAKAAENALTQTRRKRPERA